MISKHLSCKSTVNCLFPRTPGGPPISWLTCIQLGICITLQTLVRNDFTHASGESRTVNKTFAFGCIFIKSSKMQIIGKSRVDLNWPASIFWIQFYRGRRIRLIKPQEVGPCSHRNIGSIRIQGCEWKPLLYDSIKINSSVTELLLLFCLEPVSSDFKRQNGLGLKMTPKDPLDVTVKEIMKLS